MKNIDAKYARLNATKRDLLWALIKAEPCSGRDIWDELPGDEDDRAAESNLYNALRDLEDEGYVAVARHDRHENVYALNEHTRMMLQRRHNWEDEVMSND